MRWSRSERRGGAQSSARPPEGGLAVAIRRAAGGLLLAALIAVFGAVSLLLGQDANWDLQSYHYYNPWAWWHGRTLTRDLGAAQIQTFHNPLLDLPFFGLVSAGLAPRMIAFVLAVPAALAVWVLCRLAWLLSRGLPTGQRGIEVACVAVIGATSAMGLGAVGNTMNEWPLAALLALALWLIARDMVRAGGGALARRTLLMAGAIAGVACGAKLTAVTFVVGLGAALVARGPCNRDSARARAIEAAHFGLGVCVGAAIVFGPWSYRLWEHFASPVFPYANQWFQSPWWEPNPVRQPHAFGPRTLAQWWSFPFTLAQPPLFVTAEVPYTDARMAAVWALALCAGGARFLRRMQPARMRVDAADRDPGVRAAWRFIALFAIVSFVLWMALFSIYRYLLVLDLLSGLLLAGLLRALVPRRVAAAALVVVAAALVASTRIADWGRVEFGERWFMVEDPFPPVAPDALVLITTGGAVSYFIPLLPPTSRYVAVLNTLMNPARPTKLTEAAREIIATHRGPLYQLTHPLTEGADVLAAHRLVRTEACAVVLTNMPTSPLELCRLVRSDAAPHAP